MANSILGRKYGCIHDIKDERDYHFRDLFSFVPLPSKIDNSAYRNSIEDQLQEGSCTGHGWTSARESLNNLLNRFPKLQLSRQDLYRQILIAENHFGQDVGGQIRTGAKILSKLGVCAESTFPYKLGGYKLKPTKLTISDALAHAGGSYARISSIEEIRQALFRKLPIVFGFTVSTSFESKSCLSTGDIPMPNNGESVLGGHCMYIDGCDDNRRNGDLIVPNSWGTGVGDKGVFYMPYDFYRKYTMDAWVLNA